MGATCLRACGNGAQLQVLPNDTGTNSTSKLTNTGTIEFTPTGTGFRLLTDV